MYLLEMRNLGLKRITAYCSAYAPMSSNFTLNSSLIVYARCHDRIPCDIEVMDRAGHVCSRFDLVCDPCPAIGASLEGNRVAVMVYTGDMSRHCTVWDLSSGQLLTTLSPTASEQATTHFCHPAFVSANAVGTIFAFSAERSCEMHLYDATTLALLGVVTPFQGLGLMPDDNIFCFKGLVWGVHNWLFWHDGTPGRPADVSIAHVHDYQAGGCSHSQVLGRVHVSHKDHATSPGGAYVCLPNLDVGGLAIHDVRTGHVAAIFPCNPSYVRILSWSSCGRWIIIKAPGEVCGVRQRVSMMLI